MPHREKKGQVVAVIVGAVIMIGVSVVGTLYASGKLSGFTNPLAKKAYQNVTLTDAYVVCEAEIKDEFEDRIKSLAMDDHSSRYDARDRRFKIFANIELYEGEGRGAVADDYFVNCFVRGDNGRISTFDYGKDAESTGAPDTSNPFGFPR